VRFDPFAHKPAGAASARHSLHLFVRRVEIVAKLGRKSRRKAAAVWNIRVDWANYNESGLWKNVNLCRFNARQRLKYMGTSTVTRKARLLRYSEETFSSPQAMSEIIRFLPGFADRKSLL
jgi:hypothetical protein